MSSELLSLIYNKALDILSRREHSAHELKLKLHKKFEAISEIEEVIIRLENNNLLNDFRFAEIYARIRKRKGFGPKKILHELIFRGVDESIAIQVIDVEGGWKDAASNAFNKKYKAGPGKDYKEQNKQKAFLQNRGFSFEEIDSVFT